MALNHNDLVLLGRCGDVVGGNLGAGKVVCGWMDGDARARERERDLYGMWITLLIPVTTILPLMSG